VTIAKNSARKQHCLRSLKQANNKTQKCMFENHPENSLTLRVKDVRKRIRPKHLDLIMLVKSQLTKTFTRHCFALH
jgi:hypothetical protein